jgi:hypothetical protein
MRSSRLVLSPALVAASRSDDPHRRQSLSARTFRLLLTLLALSGAFCAWPLIAQITYDGCQDIRGISVASVLDYSVRDVAVAMLAPNGAPIIRYNPSVLSWFQPETRLFWYGHECGHHALGHSFGTAFPSQMEQQADCFGIRELIKSGVLSRRDVSTIQADLSRLGSGDWTHLPGPIRAMNLKACLSSSSNRTPVGANWCCDGYGNRRCALPPGTVPVGGSCVCFGIPGVGSGCN